MLKRVASSAQQAAPSGYNFLVHMWQPKYYRELQQKYTNNTKIFLVSTNVSSKSHFSHLLVLFFFHLYLQFFTSNHQQAAIMANDSHFFLHYTNGSSFYRASFHKIHGHSRQSEIHLPRQTYHSPYVRGRLYGPAIAQGSISQL